MAHETAHVVQQRGSPTPQRSAPGQSDSYEHEAQQAQEVEDLYRVLFSHPSVEGITWWDFSDQGAWMKAPAGLLRKDMSPRPAYLATLAGAVVAVLAFAGSLFVGFRLTDVRVQGDRTRGHTPLAGLLLGGVTQRLLHIAPCPVLAVPPGRDASE